MQLWVAYVILEDTGATWLRRGLQNLKCMPRMRLLAKQAQHLNINANENNFDGEAIAA